MKSRQYYEALSDQQLIDAAHFESEEGRPQPELLAVLADRLDELLDEVFHLETQIDALNDKLIN